MLRHLAVESTNSQKMVEGEIGMALLDVSRKVKFWYCDVEAHDTSLNSGQTLREWHTSKEFHNVLAHDVVRENQMRDNKSGQEEVNNKIGIDVPGLHKKRLYATRNNVPFSSSEITDRER
jgi:hypothetical protein